MEIELQLDDAEPEQEIEWRPVDDEAHVRVDDSRGSRDLHREVDARE
jgi:hypothetical protein